MPAAAALAILLALSAFVLQRAGLGPGGEQAFPSCTVTVENPGVDSRGIERAITVPLEDALAAIPGVVQVRSVSEYGRSRVTVIAGPGQGRAALSAAIRDAVQRVARGFPASARRPEIVASALGQRPAFIAAIRSTGPSAGDLHELVEREVKPRFARVEGAGEVETGGSAAREIHVRVDPGQAGLRGLSTADVAGQIARQVLLAPAGSVAGAAVRTPVSVAGRAASIGELAALPVRLPGGGSAALSQLASVSYGSRERESVSRLDGSEAVVISVHSSGTANLVALSRRLRAETARWEEQGLAFDILLDRGQSLEREVRSILSALLQAVAVVTLVLPLFVRELRRVAALAALLPLTGLVAAAAVSAAGASLDQYILSGLAVGIGTILDTGIIVSEQRGVREVRAIIPSLAASLATTLIVLVPLFFLDFAASGIRQVAAAVGLLLVVSFVLDALLLPAFFLAPLPARRPARGQATGGASVRSFGAGRLRTRARRRAARLLHTVVCASFRRPGAVLGAGGLLAAGMAAALALTGRDFSSLPGDSSIYARVEFEPGTSIETVDQRTLQLTRLLQGRPGIGAIECVARRGGAEMQVRFDPSRITREGAAELMRDAGARVPGGFLYLPEPGVSGGLGLELVIRGEDSAVLRQLAREAAALLGRAPGIRQVVLNFKDPPAGLVVAVDRDRAAAAGVRTADAAAAVRWALHGPVALKWIEADREIDLRVMTGVGSRPGGTGAARVTRADILATAVRAPDGSSRPLAGLARLEERPEAGKIFRTDRQRTASLTVHAAAGSVDTAAARIRGALQDLQLPPGYAVELDRQVRELDRSFRLLWAALGLSAVFVYLVLAGFGESFASPLAVLAVLPPSLAFPVIAWAALGQPLRVPVLVGFIMLSGMVVNSSILVIDAARALLAGGPSPVVPGRAVTLSRDVLGSAVRRAIRSRIRPLLVTSAATIAGTIPMLFARAQAGGFMASLGFVISWGMLGALASTVLVVPALAAAAPRLLGVRAVGRS